MNEPTQQQLLVLKEKFGHQKFRLKQWEVIHNVMVNKSDCLAIMATGHGKSVLFQFSAVFTDSITIVISPLISLMIDQVTALNSVNISACYLGSAQPDRNTLTKAIAGRYNLIYVTPEFITSPGGNHLLVSLKDKLNLIGIDEAHCVCQWGHDFRPTYRDLKILREIVPMVPILAVTATATNRVREDIVSSLNLCEPLIVCTGFDRPNLKFFVSRKGASFWRDCENLMPVSGSTIIYVNKRDDAEAFSRILNEKGFTTRAYHAGLDLNIRKEVQDQFKIDKIKIVVATIAFGMGIDKSDVRVIIQYGACSSIETYYQQVGRAGRDGKASKCFLFYNHQEDFAFHKFLRNLNKNKKDENIIYLEELCEQFKEFIASEGCRRNALLEYFEGESKFFVKKERNANCCDNCDKEKKGQNDEKTEKPDVKPMKWENSDDSDSDEDSQDQTQMEIEINKKIKIKIKGGKISKKITSYGRVTRYSNTNQSKTETKVRTLHEEETDLQQIFNQEKVFHESPGWQNYEREMKETELRRISGNKSDEPGASSLKRIKIEKTEIEPQSHSSTKCKKNTKKIIKPFQRKLSDYFTTVKKTFS